MSTNPLQLFLDHFLLINKERYKNDPFALKILNGLTLSNITFSNWKTSSRPDGPYQQSVDMDVVGKMVAHAQKYYTLDFASPLVSKPLDGTPVAEADLVNKTATGLYFYKDEDFDPPRIACAVVVKAPKDLYNEGIAVIKAACLLDTTDTVFTKIGDGSSVMVSATTFVDTIKILKAAITEFLYDGTYLYDGSMTY